MRKLRCAILSVICLFLMFACSSYEVERERGFENIQKIFAGVFSVNGTGTKVAFAPGNLKATYNGTGYDWEVITDLNYYVNRRINNLDESEISAGAVVDLFCWSTDEGTPDDTSDDKYGIKSAGDSSVKHEGTFEDWGNINNTDYGVKESDFEFVSYKWDPDESWRTLTKNEWLYVLGFDINGNIINDENSSPRAGKTGCAVIGEGENTLKGIILLPDNIGDYSVWDQIRAYWTPYDGNSVDWNDNTFNFKVWAGLEASGAVFLPVTGVRDAYNNKDTFSYWTSEADGESGAYFITLSDKIVVTPEARSYGRAVRMVRNMEPVPED